MNQTTFADLQALDPGPPDDTSAYGDLPQQFGELWLPRANPRATIMLIHGGCWLNTYGVDHCRPMSRALRDQGFRVWAIEYRRLGDPGGGWPGTFDDIVLAMDHLPPPLSRSAGKARVLVGHSAGGHLALWMAGRRQVPELAGVLGLAAIVDPASYARGNSDCERATIRLLGGTPAEQAQRYREATPVPGRHRTLLLHGDRDTVVPMAQSFAHGFADHARPVPGAGHFDLVHPDSEAWPHVLDALAQLLRPEGRRGPADEPGEGRDHD